jgi:zinc transport system substrate-binding protein
MQHICITPNENLELAAVCCGVENIHMLIDQIKLTVIYIVAIFGAFLLTGITNAQASKKLSVFVSIPPQKYFVQQIGQERVDIQVMVKPGASPATYEPKPRQMAAISNTHIYFAVGVPFEKTWLKKIATANPNMRVVLTDRGIQKIPMAAPRPHAEAEHREHGELDPHIWLSPALVMIQARTILAAFQEIDGNDPGAHDSSCFSGN